MFGISMAFNVPPTILFIISLLLYFCILIVFLIFSLLDGTVGPNKYGEDPRGRIPYTYE